MNRVDADGKACKRVRRQHPHFFSAHCAAGIKHQLHTPIRKGLAFPLKLWGLADNIHDG